MEDGEQESEIFVIPDSAERAALLPRSLQGRGSSPRGAQPTHNSRTRESIASVIVLSGEEGRSERGVASLAASPAGSKAAPLLPGAGRSVAVRHAEKGAEEADSVSESEDAASMARDLPGATLTQTDEGAGRGEDDVGGESRESDGGDGEDDVQEEVESGSLWERLKGRYGGRALAGWSPPPLEERSDASSTCAERDRALGLVRAQSDGPRERDGEASKSESVRAEGGRGKRKRAELADVGTGERAVVALAKKKKSKVLVKMLSVSAPSTKSQTDVLPQAIPDPGGDASGDIERASERPDGMPDFKSMDLSELKECGPRPC